MNGKKFVILTLCLVLTLIVAGGALTAVVDPFFHFHGPLPGLQYPLDSQRYQNDGILRHFEYDAVLTGSSMTETFQTSEFDDLFGTNAVKVSLSGTTLKETGDQLKRAFSYGQDIRYILFSLDDFAIGAHKDLMSETFTYPTYLYDDDPFNDVKYVLNKTVLIDHTLAVFRHTISGEPTTSFDDYSNWMDRKTFGKDTILKDFVRPEKEESKGNATQEQLRQLEENLQQNVISLVEAHPETRFYLFFPPYSIYSWDVRNQAGILQRDIDRNLRAAELLLPYENVYLFGFDTCYDMICDPDNYADMNHYGSWINSQILQWMKEEEHRLTEENYLDYFKDVRGFYTDFDYDRLYN